MKVVLDTNVLISGIGRSGEPPGRIFDAWLPERNSWSRETRNICYRWACRRL